MTRVRFRILGILVALSFVAYLLRTNMSVAGDGIMREFGLTQVQFGFILSAFAWSYALFQFPGGVFGERLGGRRALTWICALWGVVTLLTGMVPGGRLAASVSVTLAALVVLRFAMGLVQAPLFPVMGALFREWFPVSGWATPNGLSSSGLTLGAAAAGPLIAWLSQALGWRLSFVLTAPLALLAAAWWWRQGRDRPAEHRDVGEGELELIRSDRPPDPEPEQGSWKRVLRNRNLQLLTLSYFCATYVFYMFFNWFFLYLVQVRGFSQLQSGFLATLPWLAGAAGAGLGGIWADRLSIRRGIRWGCRVPCIVALVASSALLWAGAEAKNAAGAVTFLALCFGCQQIVEGPYWSAAISIGGRHAGAATGMLNCGGNAVGGFAAILVPLLAQRYGWTVALSTGSIFAIAGAALWLLVRADEPMAERSRGR